MTSILQNSKASIGLPVATFAEKFCAHYHVPLEKYEKVMLRRALYPSGQLIRLLLSADANYFAPDREFIRGVGRLTGIQGLGAEIWAFTVNPENSRAHRRHLKMRVSAKRVYELVSVVMNEQSPYPPGNSIPPI